MVNKCFTCPIVEKYVLLTSSFSEELTSALLPAFWILFVVSVGLWVVIQGLRIHLNRVTSLEVISKIPWIIIALTMMTGQGPSLINSIYKSVLSIMGGTASIALSIGQINGSSETASSNLGEGMVQLVQFAESGIGSVFGMADNIIEGGSTFDFTVYIFALVLVVPYFLVLLVYFSQVVISIFRVMMIATLSPVMVFAMTFDWGRPMMWAAFRTLIASFLTLFGSTLALAVMLYGVNSLGINSEGATSDISVGFTDPNFLLAVAMGWLGTAFMAESTSIANSISGTALGNTGAGIITAGGLGLGFAALNNPATRYAKDKSKQGLSRAGQAALDRFRGKGRDSGSGGGGK